MTKQELITSLQELACDDTTEVYFRGFVDVEGFREEVPLDVCELESENNTLYIVLW